jgi:hypothetical protein
MHRLSITLFMALCGAAFLTAQTKPDFSGTWKLNLERSDFGPFPKPAEGWTIKMDHRGAEVWTMPADAPGKRHVIYTDGRESEFEDDEVGRMTITATWEESVLVITSKYGDTKQTERWALSKDGKVWTSSRHLETSLGEGDLKHVYEKQQK